jgi:hypothetical protein
VRLDGHPESSGALVAGDDGIGHGAIVAVAAGSLAARANPA